ncbi:CHASE3 domain-containing protein [Methylomagnum sp.]
MEWFRLIGARFGLGLLSAVLILTLWVINLHRQRQIEIRRAVEYASEVSMMLEDVLSTLKDAETGERGYLITGRPDYLEPYLDARRQLPKLLARLSSRVAAHPAQGERLRAIEPLIATRLGELEKAIEARRDQGFEAAEAVVLANGRKETMRVVRHRIAEAEAQNSLHLRQHMDPALSPGAMLGTAALSGLLAFGLTSAGFRLGRRKEALEEAIRKNESLLGTVLAQMPSGVIIADAAGRLLLGNAQVERIWRHPFRPADNIADYQVYQGFHTDGRPYLPLEWPLTRSLRGGETVEGEVMYFLRGDNTCGALEVSSAPIRDHGGRIIAGVVTFHEVSERCAMERELHDSRRAFKSLVEHLPDVVFRLDRELRHLYVSPAVARYTGIAPEVLLGKTPREAGFDPADRCRFEALCRKVMASGEEATFEFDGSGRYLRCRLVAESGETGAIESILGIAEDITAQKIAEQALQEANRRKDEFLAMLAHELRNPLAPIRNAIEVLRRTLPQDPKPQWAREVMERQVAQLTRLVDDLLDVSRITRGKIRLRRESLELRAIVEQAVEISQPLILSRQHRLVVHPVPESARIDGDRARLIQVVSNLLNNAAKYTPEGGRIEVDTAVDGGEAVIRVRDNGSGISAELLPHVFEPFRQADETLARSQGGLGVGLTLARRLVELHGGRVAAQSAGIGKGSVFTVKLPCQKQNAGNFERRSGS